MACFTLYRQYFYFKLGAAINLEDVRSFQWPLPWIGWIIKYDFMSFLFNYTPLIFGCLFASNRLKFVFIFFVFYLCAWFRLMVHVTG